MIVIIPEPLIQSGIASNNAPDSSPTDVDPNTGNIMYPGLVTWTATSYSAGQYVIYAPLSIYRASEHVTNDDVPGVSPKWIYVAANNPYKFLDGLVSSPTVKEGNFIFATYSTGIFASCMCGFEIYGVTKVIITTTGIVGGIEVEIYRREIVMQEDELVMDEWDYYFMLPVDKTSFAVYDLPPTFSGITQVEFVTYSTCRVGEIVIGNAQQIGTATMGSGFKNDDPSKLIIDDFGNVTGKVLRPNVDVVNFDVVIDSTQGHSVRNARNIMRSIGKTKPCVWAGSYDENDVLLCYGFYETFDVLINYATVADCNITVRTLA